MQIRNDLPQAKQLALPRDTAEKVEHHLIEAFGTRDDALQFWNRYSSAVVVIEPQDSKATLNSLNAKQRETLLFAIQYPEYTERFDQYKLHLSILSDDGAGVYVIVPIALEERQLMEWLADE